MSNPTHQSLMARFYTKELAAKYKDRRTPYGWSITNVVRSGRENRDSSVGLYAGGEACYQQFAELFDPVIATYHQHDTSQPHHRSWALSEPLVNPDPDGRFVVSTRIRVARNFANVPFPAAVSLTQRLQQEAAVQETLERELSGRYYTLNTMPEPITTLLQEKRCLPRLGDRFLASGGFNRDWPTGRGVFVDDSQKLFIWFGEEDFLRIISLEFNADLAAVYERIVQACNLLEQAFHFAADERYGFLTSCPSNLGTTMRAGVHINLPHLHQQPDKLKAACDELGLQLRGTSGEHTAVENATYDVSNKRRLGITEAEAVTLLNKGVLALIELEQEA
ncbi:MAG: hypothetical protein KDE51_08955 [Anaerolineales bacterium]|nr:hypothetical protein [Anaerolineales bacterium]